MDTHGFDLVFACTLTSVNGMLTDAFEKMNISFSWSKDGIALQGEFGAWNLVPGGSNKLLRCNIPFKKGTLKIDNKEYQLDGCTVLVEIQLGWLGSGSVQGSGFGANTQLVFNITTKGAQVGDTSIGAVSPISYTDPNKHLDFEGAAVLMGSIVDLLIANKDKINHIFAEINVSPPATASWLTPQKWDYFYQEPHVGPAVLCILSVLSDKTLPPPAFDATVLSDDCDTFMILSQEQFLLHAVKPGLPAAYGNRVSDANFVYKTLGGTNGHIINNGFIPTNTTTWGADTYYPAITGLDIGIESSNLITSIVGYCDITGLAGANITFIGFGKSSCTYDPATQKILFSSQGVNINHQNNIPWYDYLLGVLSGGAGLIIIDIIIKAVSDTVGNSVAQSVNTTVSTGLVIESVNTCEWAGQKMKPKAGGLMGCFWLRGSL